MAETPIRKIRVPDSIWEPAAQRAQAENVSVATVVRICLQLYGSGDLFPLRSADQVHWATRVFEELSEYQALKGLVR